MTCHKQDNRQYDRAIENQSGDRMRTIRSADKIVLLNNGEIEAIGNDKEMYERSAAYRKMLSDSKIEQTVTVN